MTPRLERALQRIEGILEETEQKAIAAGLPLSGDDLARHERLRVQATSSRKAPRAADGRRSKRSSLPLAA